MVDHLYGNSLAVVGVVCANGYVDGCWCWGLYVFGWVLECKCFFVVVSF